MGTKSWGPFTGAQLTIMATAALLCLAVPGGLWAAARIQYSFVALYDPGSKQVVKLGQGGAVKITNGVAPLAVSVSDGSGPLTVDGSVTEVPPASLVRFKSYYQEITGCTQLAAPPAGSALVLKRVMFDADSNTPLGPTSIAAFYIGPTAACGTPELSFDDSPTSFGLKTFDFGPGLVVPPGQILAAQVFGMSGLVWGTGYVIPASQLSGASAAAVQSGATAPRIVARR